MDDFLSWKSLPIHTVLAYVEQHVHQWTDVLDLLMRLGLAPSSILL